MSNYSAARLLAILLSLNESVRLRTSVSFSEWRAHESDEPCATGSDGLWLLDSRDPSARDLLRRLRACDRRPPFDAALILASADRGKSAVRRMLHRIRRNRVRLSESHVAQLLAELGDHVVV